MPPPSPPTRPARRLIALSIGEIRRLFNLHGQPDQVIHQGLYWSQLRRSRQAAARRSHFKRRLRLQVEQI